MIPSPASSIVDACLVLEGALQGNGALSFVEKDGFLRLGRDDEVDWEGEGSGDGSQDKEEKLPVCDCCDVDVADAIGNQAADEI